MDETKELEELVTNAMLNDEEYIKIKKQTAIKIMMDLQLLDEIRNRVALIDQREKLQSE